MEIIIAADTIVSSPSFIICIWNDNVAVISQNLSRCSSLMDLLCEKFVIVVQGTLTFEGARDHMRILLHSFNQLEFPMGRRGMLVTSLVSKLTGDTAFGSVISTCEVCRSAHSLVLEGKHMLTLNEMEGVDVATLLGAVGSPKLSCTVCLNVASMTRTAYLDEIPSVIALETKATPGVQFRLTHNSGAIAYRLRGLIYWGEFHFVSRIIDRSGQVWFHDGMTTGSSCQWEGIIDLSSDTEWMRKAGSKTLCYCIYTVSGE
jgi:hypothetical protein